MVKDNGGKDVSKALKKNEFYKSERLADGSTVVTVLKDNNKFFGVNLEGCKFGTNEGGFINDEFTLQAIEEIKDYCESKDFGYTEYELKLELRCRFLNTIIAMM